MEEYALLLYVVIITGMPPPEKPVIAVRWTLPAAILIVLLPCVGIIM